MTEVISKLKFKNAKPQVNMFLWCLTEQYVLKTHTFFYFKTFYSPFKSTPWCQSDSGANEKVTEVSLMENQSEFRCTVQILGECEAQNA